MGVIGFRICLDQYRISRLNKDPMDKSFPAPAFEQLHRNTSFEKQYGIFETQSLAKCGNLCTLLILSRTNHVDLKATGFNNRFIVLGLPPESNIGDRTIPGHYGDVHLTLERNH